MTTAEDLHREITQLEAELDRAAEDAEGLRGELAEARERIAVLEQG